MNKTISIPVVFVIALMLAVELSASILRAVTFRDMMEMSDALVRAEVQDKEALYKTFRHIDDWGRESRSELIYTRYRLELKDVLYGDVPGKSIDLFLLGGRVGDKGMRDSAGFELETGWDIVIHLEYNDLNDVYFSAGSAQTVFLSREVEGQEVFVNLIDASRIELDREVLLTLRTEVSLDDWVRDREPALVSYDSLKAMFRAAGQR